MSDEATFEFSSLAGIQLRYARPPKALYGSMGVPIQKVGPVVPSFAQSLSAACNRLKAASPEPIHALIVASVYRKGEGSRHGKGRALDLDGVWFKEGPPVIAKKAATDANRYLAVEACFRHEFGQMLNYWYNPEHQDHWHIDDKRVPGFVPSSKQCTVFVQASLRYVFDKDLAVDGVCGPRTMSHLSEVLEDIETGLSENIRASWARFLEAVAAVGFGTLEAPLPCPPAPE